MKLLCFSKKNHINLFIVGVLILVLFFSSCITSKNTNYLQKPGGNIPAYDVSVGYEEYTLAPFDKVYIRVYSPDINTNTLINGSSQNIHMNASEGDYMELYTYMVDELGYIDLPLTGKIKVGGHEIREAKSLVKHAIQDIIIDECAVDLRVMGRSFSVIGGKINGKYPILREKMNIFQALAMAGDLSLYSDRAKIKILRETHKGHEIKTFDIRSKEIINSEFYYIQPNDVIYVQDLNTQFFSVTNIGSMFSTFFSTVSFGMLLYHLVTPDTDPGQGDLD